MFLLSEKMFFEGFPRQQLVGCIGNNTNIRFSYEFLQDLNGAYEVFEVTGGRNDQIRCVPSQETTGTQ